MREIRSLRGENEDKGMTGKIGTLEKSVTNLEAERDCSGQTTGGLRCV